MKKLWLKETKTLPQVQCLNSSASRSPHQYNCSHSRAKFKRVPTLDQDKDCSRNTSTLPVPYLSGWIKQDHIKKQAFYQTHHPKSYEREADFHRTTRKSRKVREPPVSEITASAPAQPIVPAQPENHQSPTPTTPTPPLQPHHAPQQSKIYTKTCKETSPITKSYPTNYTSTISTTSARTPTKEDSKST